MLFKSHFYLKKKKIEFLNFYDFIIIIIIYFENEFIIFTRLKKFNNIMV